MHLQGNHKITSSIGGPAGLGAIPYWSRTGKEMATCAARLYGALEANNLHTSCAFPRCLHKSSLSCTGPLLLSHSRCK